MTTYTMGALMMLAATMWPQAALACSCNFAEEAGFIHADMKQLPANACGALFLPTRPPQASILRAEGDFVIYSGVPRALSPSSFTMTSTLDKGPIPVRITRVTLPGAADGIAAPRAFRFASAADRARFRVSSRPLNWQAMLRAGRLIDISAAMQAATGLVRIGPTAGFKAGARYAIAYQGPSASWRYPAKVEHAIDAAPVTMTGADYALALDGRPERKMMARPAGGSCGYASAATVQDFHYVVPDGLKRYAGAILYFSAIRADGGPTKASTPFAQLLYQSNACDVPKLGATARGNGADMILMPCDGAGGRVSIRGWAGMLEVEDTLRPSGITGVDFANPKGASCTGFGMLKQALASGNKERIAQAVCMTGHAQGGELSAGDVAAMPDLLKLASTTSAASASVSAKGCARAALATLFILAPAQSRAFVEPFGKLLAQDMVSSDAKLARDAEERAYALLNNLKSASDAAAPASANTLLRPILPALLAALTGGASAQSAQAGDMIATFGKDAAPLVPALLAAAQGDGVRAGHAAHALTGIIGDDPRLHQVLLRHAGVAALREQACLDYNDVAGATNPDKAIALLTEAARHGSGAAVDMLARHARKARSSTPVLIGLMEQGGESGRKALEALLVVADGEPAVLAAFARQIGAGPGKEPFSSTLEKLAVLKQEGRALLPAIEARMKTPVSTQRRAALKVLIVSMALPPARARSLLARVGQAKSNGEYF
ncbi:hypothetical protein [Massilia sp. TSP1-1-2]|uniref:hypothetical protein n=1 Tax=Massilia sp. TSP1-1-2 TaxID=2804649 RepID=UPI003CF0A7DB